MMESNILHHYAFWIKLEVKKNYKNYRLEIKLKQNGQNLPHTPYIELLIMKILKKE